MVCPDDAFILRQIIPLITEGALASKYIAVQLQDAEKNKVFRDFTKKYDLLIILIIMITTIND